MTGELDEERFGELDAFLRNASNHTTGRCVEGGSPHRYSRRNLLSSLLLFPVISFFSFCSTTSTREAHTDKYHESSLFFLFKIISGDRTHQRLCTQPVKRRDFQEIQPRASSSKPLHVHRHEQSVRCWGALFAHCRRRVRTEGSGNSSGFSSCATTTTVPTVSRPRRPARPAICTYSSGRRSRISTCITFAALHRKLVDVSASIHTL